MKKSYAKIDFKNCNTDYDYTICEWQEVVSYVGFVQQQAEDLNDEEYNALKATSCLPNCEITVIMMTDIEFEYWFRDNIEANA